MAYLRPAARPEIDTLTVFRAQALSGLAAQHDELTTLRRQAHASVPAAPPTRPTTSDITSVGASQPVRPPVPGPPQRRRRGEPCPACGHEPVDASSLWSQRQDLTVTWLEPDPARPGEIVERRHCAKCQPRQQVASADCIRCGDGPILVGDLADEYTELGVLPEPVGRWLTAHGWTTTGTALICPDHH